MTKRFLAFDAQLSARLHLIYFAIAAPAVIFSALLVPPGRVPDEGNHLLRAAQIANGEMAGLRGEGGRVGGHVDSQLAKFYVAIGNNIMHGWASNDAEAARSLHWGNTFEFMAFPNTVRFVPVAYAGASVGLLTGKLLGLSIWHSFVLARIVNGLIAVMFAAWAVASCQRGKLLLSTVLLLPMSIFLMGSMSQDGFIIGLSALLVARLTRVGALDRRDYMIAAACILSVALARYPLIGLGGVLLLPMWSRAANVTRRLQLVTVAVGVLLFAAWFALNLKLQVMMRGDVPATSGPQLSYIAHHPMALLRTIWLTMHDEVDLWYQGFIGQLGWLNVTLPRSIHRVATVLLLGAAAACVVEDKKPAHRTDRLLTLTLCFSTILLMLVASYLTWTPVGYPKIEGMQGRYFYSLAVFLPFVLPHLTPGLGGALRGGLHAAVTILCLVCAVGVLAKSDHVLKTHYAVDAAGHEAEKPVVAQWLVTTSKKLVGLN